ncbi:peptide ABC transporter substrate-binding protein [Parasphingorhabdus pacifica]
MRKRRLAAYVAAPLAVGLLASACGGGGGGAAEDGVISVNSTEPQNPLVPSDTTETGGGNVVDAMFTGLVGYDEKNEVYNEVAESIETTDNKVYTITLKPDWTFHDGSPVTSESFVRAWNYAAYAPNGQSTASFFEHIEGYDQVNPDDPDGDSGPQEPPEPSAEKLSGLEVVDEHTFKVTLDAPFATFPTTLGYPAFSPMPNTFFEDQEGFEQHPIGNGPFKFESRTPNTSIELARNDEYAGVNKPSVEGVEFRIYTELETAYQDLVSGNLDFVDQMPPSAMAGDKWKADLGDRAIEKQILSNNALQLPLYQEKYQDPKVRHALSMAINREQITETVFQGGYTPAKGWIPQDAIPGYEGAACGQWCEFDPAKAKQLLGETGFEGPIVISSNSDGGHKEWIEAVCGQFKNNLGVDCVYNPIPTFAEFLKTHETNGHEGPFRFGWVGDYPAAETFLGKIYRTGASSNYMTYSSPAFDEAMNKADRAASVEEGNKLYNEAAKVLAEDMPSIPLWDQKAVVGHSERLKNVHVTFDRHLDFERVELAS